MRTYWFEIFECVRKILLVGLPIFCPPGSPGQLILGQLICFITYGLYALFAPYVEDIYDRCRARPLFYHGSGRPSISALGFAATFVVPVAAAALVLAVSRACRRR